MEIPWREAVLYVKCMDETGALTRSNFYVAPASRFSLRVAEVMEGGHDVSAVVSSDLDIVVERPMYFLLDPSSF
jgi:hypothetical protein